MADLYIDLLATAVKRKPDNGLETRMNAFLLGDLRTESLDTPEFDQINGHGAKADYLLAGRRMIAELKTLNGDPSARTEQRLAERLKQPGAPIVFGQVGVSAITRALPGGQQVDKMMVDMAGRAVRRHLHKANEQIGETKERLDLCDTGGLLILMNDSEPDIDASAIAFTVKTMFEEAAEDFKHVTNVWAVVESHRIAMPGGRIGFPHLHIFRSLDRQGDLDCMLELLNGWPELGGAPMERVPHRGDWDSMRPILDAPRPPLRPFE